MSLQPFASMPAMVRQAATPLAGYTLVNGTGNIITWNVPNDNQLHRFTVFAAEDITVATTGGTIAVSFTMPDNTGGAWGVLPGTQASLGFNFSQTSYLVLAKPGTTVTVLQSSALTAGAAVAWAEIWGS